MQEQEIFLVSPSHDGIRWLDDEVHAVSPIPSVRRHLGGRWESSKEYVPGQVKAYFNGAARVLVMKFKSGTTLEEAHRILGEIRRGREDLS